MKCENVCLRVYTLGVVWTSGPGFTAGPIPDPGQTDFGAPWRGEVTSIGGEGGSVGSELPGVDMLGVRYISCCDELGEAPGDVMGP